MPPETKPEEKPSGLPEEVTKVLEDLKNAADRINKPPEEETPKDAPQTTWAEQREADRKALGFTEEQMQAHERTQMRVTAPIIERTGWAHIDKKPDIDTYRKEIEAELKVYPQERRTPDILEKIYYYVKGKHADSKPAEIKPNSGKVVDTRVTRGPGYTGADAGLPSAGKAEGGSEDEEALSEQEKFVCQRMGITEKEYRDSKEAGKSIRKLRVPDERPANSLADLELRRLSKVR